MTAITGLQEGQAMRYLARILSSTLVTLAVAVGPGVDEANAAAGYRKPSRSYVYRPYSSHRYRYRRHFGARRYYYRPYYRSYYSYYYRPYYLGLYSGAYLYAAGYGYYDYGPGDYAYWRGAVRTLVKPVETQVYVDGYYAGIVDDFDGIFQRLYLDPGEHEIELRLDGHRSFRQSLLLSPGSTYKIHHQMERLAPGERRPPTAGPRDRPREREKREPLDRPEEEERRPRARVYRDEEIRKPTGARPVSSSFGLLSLRVQPADAEVLIDGEPWGTLEGFGQLDIHLSEGTHRIEIRKEGYRSFTSELEVRRGEETPLNVRLTR
ncbi:MAG: PEGA domain-containing protein [Acidobacteriota bacterium]